MELTKGSLKQILDDVKVQSPIMKVINLKSLQSENNQPPRHRLILSDGLDSNTYVMLATQLNDKLISGELVAGSIIRIDNYLLKNQGDKKILVLLGLTVMKENEINEAPVQPVAIVEHAIKKQITVTTPQVCKTRAMPIESINSYQNKWTIEGRVSQKTAMKTYNNTKGEGKLFNFVLCDTTGDVKITAFNNEASKFYDIIEIGKTYSVSKGSVRVANAQWNTTKSDFEITLNTESEICETEDSSELPKMTFDFVSIDKIGEKPVNSFIDVVGIAHTVSETSMVVNKTTMKETPKREVTLVDRSCSSIRLTFWGNDIHKIDNVDHPVIVVKGASVREFNGKTLSCGQNATIIVNPLDMPEATSLMGWYSENVEFVTFHGQQGGGAGSLQLQTKRSTLSCLPHDNSSEKADFFTVEAYISHIKRDNLVYKACPAEKCNKKVQDLNNGLYKCEKCNVETSEFKYRLIMNLNLIDNTSTQWATCFQEVGELVMGHSAEQIGELIDLEKKNEIENMVKDALFKRLEFKLRVKSETYNDETRMRVTIVDAKELNLVAAITRMMSQISV